MIKHEKRSGTRLCPTNMRDNFSTDRPYWPIMTSPEACIPIISSQRTNLNNFFLVSITSLKSEGPTHQPLPRTDFIIIKASWWNAKGKGCSCAERPRRGFVGENKGKSVRLEHCSYQKGGTPNVYLLLQNMHDRGENGTKRPMTRFRMTVLKCGNYLPTTTYLSDTSKMKKISRIPHLGWSRDRVQSRSSWEIVLPWGLG